MDFRLASNRFAVVVPAIAGAVAGLVTLVTGDTFVAALRTGVAAGGASFLGWACARELDPDRTLTAAVAALVAPFMVTLGEPAIAAGFVWVMALRALAGTTGAPVFVADLVLFGLIAAVAAMGEGGLTAVGIGVVVMALYAFIEPTGRPRVLVACVLVVAVAVAIAAVRDHLVGPGAFQSSTAWWLVAVALGTMAAIRVTVTSATDRRPRPLSQRRVRLAVVSASVCCLVVVAWHGPAGAYRAGPLLVALWVTGVVALWPQRNSST